MATITQIRFDNRLVDLLSDAVDEGKRSVRVRAGDLEKAVIGDDTPKKKDAGMACFAIRKMFDSGQGDTWINANNGRDSPDVEAEFKLPRRKMR